MDKESSFNMESFWQVLLGVIIIVGVILSIEYSYVFITIPIFSIVTFLYMEKKKKERRKVFYMENIKKQWGKEHKQKRDFVHIEKLYRYFQEEEKSDFTIDNITWKDLNMNTVFEKIDHTMSLPGMQYLYNILKKPVFNRNLLEKRKVKLDILLENKEVCQDIQYPLFILGKEEGKDIFDYFKNGINVGENPLKLYTILSYLPFGVLGLFFVNSGYGVLGFFLLIAINNLLYQSNKKNIYSQMKTFKYLGSLVNCAESIIEVNKDLLDINQEEIKEILNKVSSLRKNMKKINYNESYMSEAQIILHYYNMIILKEPKVFYKAVNIMNKYREELFRLYNIIGEIDCYIAMASYKDGLYYYSTPTLVDKQGEFILNTEELYHPLLDNPVSYSFELENKGALVTGSNASGKSTFLRAIGINCIFAQSFYFVHGESYEASYFKLLTSIGTTDNIIQGDSYFMSEAKSLKRIIDSLNDEYPVLCILDEIFRGTNTAERINGALEVLNYVTNKNSCVIAATHDLELTNLVNNRFKNYHFKETIENRDIKFDYLLRGGPCTTRNAIAILEYLGYPKDIYENARKGAENYLL